MSAPYLLVYDIPERSPVANPSNFLRRIAFRINLSCWVIQEDNIPYSLLHRLERNGVRWYTVRFDVTENEKLVKMAVESMTNEVKEVVRRGNRTCAAATAELNAGNDTPTDAIKKHRKACIKVAKRIGSLVKDLKQAARCFGIDEKQLNLDHARHQIQGIRSSMAERAKVFVEAVAQLEAYAGSSDPIVKAAKAGQCPTWILADYMDDRDLRKAKKLRGMFG